MNVLILSYSYVARDIRIIKHEHFFKKAGHAVTVCGYDEPRQKRFGSHEKISYLLNMFRKPERSVEILYGRLSPPDALYDVIVCNDWNTLPLGYELARKYNAKLIYDSHEMATRQFGIKLPKWFFMIKPLAGIIEKKYIHSAVLVSAVSPGIVNALKDKYGLKNAILLRNIPIQAPKDKDRINEEIGHEKIRIYYHGGVTRLRGLEILAEAAVKSKNTELFLRLVGNFAWLKKRFEDQPNIFFLEPEPPTTIGQDFHRFDIGATIFPPNSFNHIHVMPNKFFEYALNGLPVLVSEENVDLNELVHDYGLGFSVKKYNVASLVRLFDSIDMDDVRSAKTRLRSSNFNVSAEKDWGRWISEIFA